jgi:hypothetical protein
MFQTKFVEKIETYFIFYNFIPKIVMLRRQCGKNMVEPERPQMTI